MKPAMTDHLRVWSTDSVRARRAVVCLLLLWSWLCCCPEIPANGPAGMCRWTLVTLIMSGREKNDAFLLRGNIHETIKAIPLDMERRKEKH